MPAPRPWTPTALAAPVAALASDGGDAYAALADGRVLRSPDGGDTWISIGGVGAGGSDVLLPTPDALLLPVSGGLRRVLLGGDLGPVEGLPDPVHVRALSRVDGVVVAGTLRRGAFRSEDGGATWTAASRGLPFGGAGLAVPGLAAAGGELFAVHPLGVSRSGDGGRGWEAAGFGLPLQMRHVVLAAAGPRLLAEVDGRLFGLVDGVWVERDLGPVALLGADAGALYGIATEGGLVWAPVDGGGWRPHGEGLPGSPWALALGTGWRLAALEGGGVWRRPAAPPPPAEAGLRLDAVPPFLTGGPAEVAFWLPSPTEIALSLVDGAGTEAARLAGGPYEAGPHRVALPPTRLPAGLYRCRLVADGHAVSLPLAVVPTT